MDARPFPADLSEDRPYVSSTRAFDNGRGVREVHLDTVGVRLGGTSESILGSQRLSTLHKDGCVVVRVVDAVKAYGYHSYSLLVKHIPVALSNLHIHMQCVCQAPRSRAKSSRRWYSGVMSRARSVAGPGYFGLPFIRAWRDG